MTIEERWATHLANVRYEECGVSAREAVDRLLLDTMAVAVAGLNSPKCRHLVRDGLHVGGRAQSSVAGAPHRIPAPTAAFLNAVLAHWYEWDDTHDTAAIHGAAVIFPALLAVAEACDQDRGSLSGKRFLAAAIAAYDVAREISSSLIPFEHRGWMPTGFGSSIGAAGGAAALIGLGSDGILSAMGIAAEMAGLSREPLIEKVDGKNILCGLAAKQAVDAALMANNGIRGAAEFFGGRYGLNALIAAGKADLAGRSTAMQAPSAVEEAAIKPYPSCRSTHPGIDVALRLRREHPTIAAEARKVRIVAPQGVYDLVGAPFDPGSDGRVAAQFNISYTVAVALRNGRVSLGDFDDSMFNDPDVRGLTAMTTVDPVPAESPTVWWRPLSIQVTNRNGKSVTGLIDHLRGSPQNPLSATELDQKLALALGGSFSASKVSRFKELANSVSREGVRPLAAALRSAASPMREGHATSQ